MKIREYINFLIMKEVGNLLEKITDPINIMIIVIRLMAGCF